jgi:hypothetical protein
MKLQISIMWFRTQSLSNQKLSVVAYHPQNTMTKLFQSFVVVVVD